MDERTRLLAEQAIWSRDRGAQYVGPGVWSTGASAPCTAAVGRSTEASLKRASEISVGRIDLTSRSRAQEFGAERGWVGARA